MAELFGVWPALITPFTADNQVHVETIERLVAYHLDKGVNGFYACGSTGSGVYQSVAERKLVLETMMSAIDGRVPVVVHVGAVALTDAIDLAQHARDQGAAGFSSIIPPLYPSLDAVLAYYKALAEAVPDLGFFPYIARPEFNAFELVSRLMALPNVIGTKYTGPNMYEFSQIARLRDENWTVFSGMDEQSVFAAMSGSCGHIGSTLNFMPGAYAKIRALLAAGEHDAAVALQLRANDVTTHMIAVGFSGALYDVMQLLGFDCGAPRLPSLPLSDAAKRDLHANLESAGFQELAAM